MKLDRGTNPDGRGKYALINLRTAQPPFRSELPDGEEWAHQLVPTEAIEWGLPGAPDEFFVLKLRDLGSQPALRAYADAMQEHDPEYAAAVRELAERAGPAHPLAKWPD